MKQRLFRCLAALLMISALLTGCWQGEIEDSGVNGLVSPDEEIPETSSKVILPETFSLPYAPDQTLDPITCPDGMQQVVGSLLYEGLFRLNHQFSPENQLCSSYDYDPDSHVYTFTLRSGVTFSDGSPLTAADVKATLDRARTSPRYGARFSAVTSIRAGDGQVTIALSGPNRGFPALLDIPIVKAGTEKGGAPLGTGPYLLAGDGTAALVASQTWWQGDGQPVDRIALVETSDRDSMLYRFSSHDVQLITADLTGTDPITATGNISFLDADTTVLQYLGCNVSRPPLDNAAFRQALWQGIDRAYVVSAFLSSHGTAAQYPVPPASELYPAALEARYSYDGFTAALAESGYAADRELTLLVNTENSFKVSIAQALAESFTGAGVPVKVRALPWAEYTAALAAGDFDLYYGEVRLTADWDLSSLLASSGALNYGGWADPQTDQLLAAYAAAEDRAAALEALCARLKTAAPILPVCFKSTSVLMQADVMEGLSPTAAEPFYDLASCAIHLRDP